MTKKEAIQLFEDRKVRTLWDTDKEQWYFSIVDVIAVLTDQNDYQGARNYWKVLKFRLLKEGNVTVTNCNQLKLLAEDGKMRLTDVADTEQLFRLIQSIPSHKAEPFKLWLAQIAAERLDEMQDPELTIDRALEQTKIVEYIKRCKKRLGRELLIETEASFYKVIGEVMSNAEEHGTMPQRFAIGFFQEVHNDDNHFGTFNFSIFNFGDTIYQTTFAPYFFPGTMISARILIKFDNTNIQSDGTENL